MELVVKNRANEQLLDETNLFKAKITELKKNEIESLSAGKAETGR